MIQVTIPTVSSKIVSHVQGIFVMEHLTGHDQQL
jgi:hypothetical protein